MLALIPARGQSESIEKKNLQKIGNYTLVEWVIQAAEQCPTIDEIVVTTDDPEISSIAGRAGAVVRQRPAALSGADIPVFEVVKDYCESRAIKDLAITLLQPTSPFVKPNVIRACGDLLQDFSSSQSITPVEHNNHVINQRVLVEGVVHWVEPELRALCHNKQLKPPRYKFGNCLAFWWSKAEEQETLFPELSAGVIIPRLEAWDVDEWNDLQIAEAIFKWGLI